VSVLFGRWSYDGRQADHTYMEKVSTLITAYGPDADGSYTGDGVTILYRGLHTTHESHAEKQPYLLPSGEVLAWDGRLDNREDLIHALDGAVAARSADISIVGAAYERWGRASFSKLIGDWALAIWNPYEHTLVLAKDFLGAKHLYYHFDDRQVTWCTLLEPLVLCDGKELPLDEEYLAGWLSSFPAAHLSPFRPIRSVPPSSFVCIRNRCMAVQGYWDLDSLKIVRYRSDAQYEEHFRSVFGEAVRRRLRSDGPVAAELSGGMDSSSIVCTADEIIAGKVGDTPRLDTLSYFDDSEASWNERPYFALVEEKRGRTGFHVDLARYSAFPSGCAHQTFLTTPGSAIQHTEASQQIAAYLKSQGTRVLLSGLGGDELLGGAPAPLPELANLLSQAAFLRFVRQSLAWALAIREPAHHLIAKTMKAFLPLALVGTGERMPAWLEPCFVKRHYHALHGYHRRLTLFRYRPSVQANTLALEALRRQIACHHPPSSLCEKRFPFLDRDLWEFVSAVPREQILRSSQRRSLMRRALRGVVPNGILDRRRKAFVTRALFANVLSNWPASKQSAEPMVSASLGIVNARAFEQALERARNGQEASAVPLVRMLLVEIWLKHLQENARHRSYEFVATKPPTSLKNIATSRVLTT
jgi:asparagine synthase (glutamine-hydrolysing)